MAVYRNENRATFKRKTAENNEKLAITCVSAFFQIGESPSTSDAFAEDCP